MAILSTLEGQAHVEIESDDLHWKGYILIEPDPGNLRYFDESGPQSITMYEGPVMADGKYHFASGKVKILAVNYKNKPEELRVDFKGIEELNISKTYEGKPDDFVD